jgi:hypothetical protein
MAQGNDFFNILVLPAVQELLRPSAGERLPTRRLVFLLPLLGMGIALSFAHISVLRMGDDYKGGLLLGDRIFDLCLALGLTGIAFCVGRRTARLLSLSSANVAEELSFSIMIGVGICGLVTLGLGLSGFLAPIPVVLSFGLLMILSWREVATLYRVLKEGIVKATSTRLGLVLTIVFCALAVILVLRSMTPPHTPDESIYHLSVPKRFVEQGRVFPVGDNWAGNMPFLIQMLYALSLMAKADIATKLFSLCLAFVCSLSLYAFGCRFLTRRAGLVAMFSFFAAGMVVEVAVTARIDVSLAAMLFLATYAMMVYFQTRQSVWLYTSAMLAGFGLGIKYSAGIAIFFLGVMFLVESLLRRQESAVTITRRALLFTAILTVVASPWFIKNLVWFGNPVYPFITGEAADLTPGRFRYFKAEDQTRLAAHFERAHRQMPDLVVDRERQMAAAAAKRVDRHPLRFWEYFTKPGSYSMAEDFQYPNYLFLFAPLIIFAPRNRWLIWLGLFSVVFFLATVTNSWIARLLLPIYPALTLISAYAVSELAAALDWDLWRKRLMPRARVLPALAVAFALVPTALLSILQLMNSRDLSFTRGGISRSEYMNNFYYYPPSRFINTSIPEGSRVMMIGAQTSYDLRRDYIADVNWDSTEWRRMLVHNNTMAELNEDMKRRGITHVWVAYALFTFVAEMGRANYPNVSGPRVEAGPDYQTQLMNWLALDLYSTTYLEPIYKDDFDNMVYRVK